MKRHKNILTGCLASLGMLVLILDGKTALAGAREGILLCLSTLIPSLFPFLILSIFLNSLFIGKRIHALRPLGRLCGIPAGGESLLLLGLLGGYPVGAQSITDAYTNGYISKSTAHRLLGFCNNAGPAFIFGMSAAQFSSPVVPWIIWFIHILSALLVGVTLAEDRGEKCNIPAGKPITLPQALENSIKIIAQICSWVVLFRVILVFLMRWLFWILPLWLQVMFTGTLELTNGCVQLHLISIQGLRLIVSVCMLSFGGLCVGMQTISVTEGLGTGMYFPGKILQTIISVILAGIMQLLLFSSTDLCIITPIFWVILFSLAIGTPIYLRARKKVVVIQQKIMYNKKSLC